MTVPVHGLPSLLHVGLEVALVPPPLKESRWRVVEDVVSVDDRGALVRLSQCGDIAAAEALVGKTLLARVSDLPEGYERYDVDALIGRTVIEDASGRTGVLQGVLRGPGNDVWEISLTDGQTEETYLIPVIDEVVREVPQDGAVRVRLPEGLEPEERTVVRRAEGQGEVRDAL